MNQNTLPCSNCKAQIDESKHALHEMFCLRNNIKCPKCGHFYDKNDPESHEEEFHRKEKCQHCQKEFDDLSKHSCSMKPKQCLYCDLTFPATQFQQHENYCGSRTEKCDKCAQSIMKRDIIYHNCAPPKQEIISKPTQKEIFDKPKEFDANYEQQKYATKKETNVTTQKPSGNGQKFTQAQSERPVQQTIKFNEKVSDKNQTRPTSNQQNRAQQNQPSSYNVKKNEQTQFDSKYEKDQYNNKQKQPPSMQAPQTLESFNRPVVKPTTQPREQLKRPDTAIAREFQKQQEIEDLGITPEEYLQQQMMMEEMEKQSKPQPQQQQQQQQSKTQQQQQQQSKPQPQQQQQQSKPQSQQMSKAQQPSHQQHRSQPLQFEDEFSFLSKEELEEQRQIIESLQKNKK